MIFLAVLNETMFNVSTPMIASQFSLSASGVSWMMNIFMIFFGIGAVIYFATGMPGQEKLAIRFYSVRRRSERISLQRY
jgi:MFS family permease